MGAPKTETNLAPVPSETSKEPEVNSRYCTSTRKTRRKVWGAEPGVGGLGARKVRGAGCGGWSGGGGLRGATEPRPLDLWGGGVVSFERGEGSRGGGGGEAAYVLFMRRAGACGAEMRRARIIL